MAQGWKISNRILKEGGNNHRASRSDGILCSLGIDPTSGEQWRSSHSCQTQKNKERRAHRYDMFMGGMRSRNLTTVLTRSMVMLFACKPDCVSSAGTCACQWSLSAPRAWGKLHTPPTHFFFKHPGVLYDGATR